MRKKLIYLTSSFFFLLLSLIISQHYSYLNTIQVPVSIPVIGFLILLCTTIVLTSKDEENAVHFYRIIFLISLYLLLDQIPLLYIGFISALIISYLPFLLYDFFVMFNFIPISILSKKLEKFLFIYSLFTFVLLSLSFESFYWLILLEIVLTILFCVYLYSKEKDRLSTKTRNEQTLLTKSLVLSLTPFVLSYSLFNSVLPDDIKVYSLFFVLLIPITVSIILIRRNNMRFNIEAIVVNILTHLFCFSLFFIVSHFFIDLSFFGLYYSIILYGVFLYTIQLKNWYLTNRELKKIQQIKTGYQKEKLNLVQSITKEKTLSSISTLINKLLMQNYGIFNYLVVWKDSHNPYILSCEGQLADISLTKPVVDSLEEHSNIFLFQCNEFSKYTFCKKNKILGWFILDKEENRILSLDENKTIDNLVEVIGEIILENERLYDIKQEASKIESLSYDEYVNFEYLNMVQNFHKDFSFFLHDNVLQNILALKKLTESLNTEQSETKQLMLKTFDDLNQIFRNKIFELYPSTIEKAPLSDSIKTLCTKLNEDQDSINISFYCPKDFWLKKEQKFHIYRIVQELLVNAIKHSQATEIKVSLIKSEHFVESIVQDNGIGFDLGKIKLREIENEHFGILSINQEVNSLNGQMTVSPVHPQGTIFKIVLPISQEEVIF